MAVKKWADVRERHIDAAGAEVVAEHSAQMLAQVRAHTLADVRRRKGLTEAGRRNHGLHRGDGSPRWGTATCRGSVLDRYVHALCGQLGLVASSATSNSRSGSSATVQ